MGFQNTGYIYCGAPPAGHGGLLYKAVVKRAVFGHATHAQKTACLNDANMYEHGAV